MIENLDVQFGASAPGLGGQVREVVSSINSVRDAVDALEGFMDGFRQGVREAFGDPGNGLHNGAQEAERDMRELRQETERTGREVRETSREMGGMGDALGSVKRLAGGLLLGMGVMEVGKQIVETASEFEKLRGVLQTLEPAQGVAAARFEDLRKLAATTPFSLEEVVTAFSKLKAMGLDPSSAAITSYGNTASAMGKSLEQMIEAVADAATGEFERLKEFGIKSKQQGDEVTFTFQGVSTTVKKNSQDIQDYLMKIGDVNFAGAMERQAATFGGMMSNLGDNLANVANEIGQGGLMDALKEIVTDMNNAGGGAGELAGMLGGVLGTAVREIWQLVLTLSEAFSEIFRTIGEVISSFTGQTMTNGEMLRNIFTAIQLVIVGFGYTIRVTFIIAQAIVQEVAAYIGAALRAINAALHFDFQGYINNMRTWRDQAVQIATDAANRIAEETRRSNETMAKLQAPQKTAKKGAVELPTYTPPPPSSGGGGAGKKASGGNAAASRLQLWQEELRSMEIASGEFFKDNTQQELDFWRGKLALTREGSKDWASVQEKIFAASKTLAQQQYQEQIASLDFQMQQAQGNYARQAELEQQKVDLVRRTYGEQSSQYRNALREQERMAQQHEDELRRIRQQGIQQRGSIDADAARTDTEIQRTALQQQNDLVQYQEGAGLIGRQQAAARRTAIALAEFEAQVALEQRLYDIKAQSLRDQLALEGLKPQEMARINSEIEQEAAAHQQRVRAQSAQMSALLQRGNIDAANATREVWTSRLAPVTQALTGMVNGFLQGTTSVRQAMLQMGSQILQQLNGWIMNWVQQHVVAQQAATAATVGGNAARQASNAATAAAQAGTTAATATSEITTNAAVAGSGALASISKIPVIGPFIAPAIAAGILALAMGFIGKIASAEGGWGQVPYDGAMTELHKDEMVLPASIASPLRDALAGKDSTWSLGQTGLAARKMMDGELRDRPEINESVRGGDTHFHLNALDTRSGVDWLMRNRRAVGKALGQAYREGSR